MAIVLTIHVQNMVHQTVRTLVEPDDEPFLRFCRRVEPLGARNVDFVWPYTDSMLNHVQLRSWTIDFPPLLQDPSVPQDERESASRVLQAAQEALDLDGYLFIEG